MTPLLQEKNPCEIEGRNFKRHYTEPAIGKVYRLSFEVDKELWDACELIPKSATIKGVLWYESEGSDFKPESKAHAEETCPDSDCPIHGTKGPHGKYWQGLFKSGFYNQLDLMEVLDIAADSEQARHMLHKKLGVKSLTLVSPDAFEEWCKNHELHSLITLSRTVRAKLEA